MARAASASKGMNIDAFLDHGEGGGAKFLRVDFKEDDEYNVWLHPKSEIFVQWRVVWRSLSDDGNKVRLWRWNSMESPAILDKQRFKNEAGTFQHTPKVDPFSLLLEWVSVQIKEGGIGWCDEIFKWEPEDADDVIIHAGGFTGMFQSRDLEKAERMEMRKAGATQDRAYMQDARPMEETVICVVDNDNPGNGPQIATIKRGLANALRLAVKNQRKKYSTEPEKADPFKTPVCFNFEKIIPENDAPPKYNVVALDNKELTEEIQAAFDLDPPDTSKMQEQSNVAMLRKCFEDHWCHDVVPPWDEIFKAAEEVVKGTPAATLADDTSFDHGANKKPSKKVEEETDDEAEEEKPVEKKAAPPKKVEKVEEKKSAPEPDEEEETEEEAPVEASEGDAVCESCDGVLEAKLFKGDPDTVICPHCGATYDHDKQKDEYVLRKKEEKPKIRASRRPKE